MSQYLKHFTTVGDEPPPQWDEEELHVASEELSPATGLFPTTLTFRQSLQRLFSCDRFQVRCFGLHSASVGRPTPVIHHFKSKFYGFSALMPLM